MFLYIFWAFFSLLIIGGLFLSFKIAQTDMRRRIIPDGYLFPLLIIGTIIVTFFPWPHPIENGVIGMAFGYIMAAIVGTVFDKILSHKSPNQTPPIGMGDIKLIATGGMWCGVFGLAIALIVACITGAIWAWAKHTRFIPFAPFFIVGGILSLIATTFLL